MHPEFIKWLSEQKYRYYKGDPLNDDTKQDWVLDRVIESSRSSPMIASWGNILRRG